MKVITCPECTSQVVECDNAVYLDYPATLYNERTAQWTIMSLGPMKLAGVGDPSPNGMGHALHEHQPTESVMA